MSFRIGFGFDVHQLGENHELLIGGVKIPSEKGAIGHSDADVLLHAICDAMLGALNKRDIGFHFPNTDKKFKGISSLVLLEKSYQIIRESGYKIVNIDSTVCLEEPAINPHVPKMQTAIAQVLQTDSDRISIKATTNEKIGYIGRNEGLTAYAVVLLETGL